jgi:16S rRNA (guanine966-N2)-methyltransferase
MRVIAGTAKGRRLRVPAGLHVRPSGARLRESAFGILEHRGAIEGARVLDLFAGTGALGIEALSRGAASLVAVEQDRAVARLLQSNVDSAGFADRARIVLQPAERAVTHLPSGESFDLVLLDPPYRKDLAQPVLERLAERGLVTHGGLVLVEHARAESLQWPETWELELERRYGDSTITLLRATQPDHRSEVPHHAHH